MSIYSEIDRLELAKENLKLKLESKGVTVPADARISDYAALINLLPEIKESEFTNRIVDNGNSGTGKAKIYSIKGRTRVWNQLVRVSSFYVGAANGITYTRDGNTIIANGTATDLSFAQVDLASLIAGHKYLVKGSPKGGTSQTYYVDVPSVGKDLGDGFVGTRAESSNNFIRIYINKGVVANNLEFKLMCIDLTLLYGTDIDGLTNAEILAKYEAEFGTGYHEYNEGTPINNDAEAIESTGFNLWDEEYLQGYWAANAGEQQPSTPAGHNERICGAHKIPCFPNTTYYVNFPVISTNTHWGVNLQFYDAAGLFLTTSNWINFPSTFTTPLNACYILIGSIYYAVNSINQLITPVDADNICINISNPDKNGTYEPYKKDTCNLGLNSFRVKDSEDNIITVNGLNSVRDAYDEIAGKYIKRLYKITFTGDETYWQYAAETFRTGNAIFNTHPLPKFNQSYSRGSGISGHFGLNTPGVGIAPAGKWDITDAGQWGITFSNSIVSSLASSTDVNDWKAWLAAQYAAGTPLTIIYELATPIEYELVDEIDTIYDVDKDGVERIVSPVHADGSPSAPFRASIGYPVNQE